MFVSHATVYLSRREIARGARHRFRARCESTDVPLGDVARGSRPRNDVASPSLDAPDAFVSCSTGSGIFGRWSPTTRALPAYEYELDENADPRASFFNTEKLDRRDHWFSFGNQRVTALATNDGPIELTMQDRGITYLDKIDHDHGNHGGGFSYIDDGDATWSTAYAWRPRGAKTSRLFGMGYAREHDGARGIRVTRTTFAPPGDVPAIVDEVLIENTEPRRSTCGTTRCWDVAPAAHRDELDRVGLPLTSVPESGPRGARRAQRYVRRGRLASTSAKRPRPAPHVGRRITRARKRGTERDGRLSGRSVPRRARRDDQMQSTRIRTRSSAREDPARPTR